jgi:hypothetical protein
MMTQQTFFATFMGGIAAEALSKHQSGFVMGITSKGIFLRCGDYVLFVTDAPYKSPFNIYVPGFERLMKKLEINMSFEVAEGIKFIDVPIHINFLNAETWIPGIPVALTTTVEDQMGEIDSLLRKIIEIEPNKGWLFLFTGGSTLPDEITQRIVTNTKWFRSEFQAQDFDGCMAAANQLLGLGGGLTPSGDDWLAGFLLYQARVHMARNTRSGFLELLIDQIGKSAIQKTTTISVNRILAAGRGWSEEPFLQVIDALFSGKDFPEGLAELIAHFGHSSGVDTTLGIQASIASE